MTEEYIAEMVKTDSWMMRVLSAAEELNLPNWWIGAGFLRNKVWDVLSGNTFEPTRDVDLVYFNNTQKAPEDDWDYDEKMKTKYPFAEWEVRNQARMHYVNGSKPFTSTEDGISNWVETATCVAVRLNKGEIELLFCHGLNDLANLIARPIPSFQSKNCIDIFHGRVEKKQWKKRWPALVVIDS